MRRIHHLNCMTFHFGVPGITHCLLIEDPDRLFLVDSGLGTGDYAHPTLRARVFLKLNRISRDPQQTAVHQIAALGFSPQDVREIALTHLHIDHAGGLPDFPWAQVHVLAAEHQAAMAPKPFSLLEGGYAAEHWAHNPRWAIHQLSGPRWFDLPCAQISASPAGRILLVPLFGHSRGHCGVAVETESGWLLHCGDAYIRQGQVDPLCPLPALPRGAGFFERYVFPLAARAIIRRLLREHGDQVRAFCAHDPAAFAQLRGAPKERA